MQSAWIQHPVVLAGPRVALRPLEAGDLDDLFAVASDPEIWKLTSVDYSVRDVFYPNFTTALEDRRSGRAYPFVILDRASGRIVGTTRFLDIHPADRKLEIGVTWMAPACWGTGANMESKFLLLQYCFEVLHAHRVQFRAKADNLRSRRALEKIGASFEGVRRKDKIEPGGTPRNTAYYSVVDDEWPAIKAALAGRLAQASAPQRA